LYVGNQPSIVSLHSTLDSEDEDEVLGRIYDRRVISRLPVYLSKVKTWMLLGGSGVIIYTLASLALPYLAAIIIDDYIQKGNLDGFNIIIGLLLAALLFAWLGQFLEERFLNYAGDRVLFLLRTEMFDHLQQLPLSFFDRNKVGRIMSRVQNDVQQLQQLISYGIISIVTSVLTLIGIIVIMTLMDARLALLTLTVIPALVIITIIWQKHARRAFIRVRRAIAVVTSYLQEGISGVRVIQSLSREDINLQQFDVVNKVHLKANLHAMRMTSITMPAVEILTAASMALVIFYGGYQVINGNLGIGILLAFILYVQRFFNPVIELAAEYTELQRAMVSGSRILELLDVEPQIKDSPQATELKDTQGKIRFDHVSFGYTPENEILHDINLTIEPGETVAIVGRTGAGKSSLVNLISRFYEVSRGTLTVDGKDIRSVTQLSLRRQMGIVPQDPFLFSGTIEDNIKYGHPEASHEDVVKAAKIAAIHDFISRLEKGYGTPVGERGINLSNGQRQFICLARALLLNPPILILDEATSNIDTNSERLMQRALQRLLLGRTCITIAHRLSTVINADRIIVLEKGCIVEEGPHRELLEKQGLYYQLFQALTGEY
jgi:ABC-type multidrug transport system fused ATPase/permease subunit